ncbi:unnamed protein product [Withania somnifera]
MPNPDPSLLSIYLSTTHFLFYYTKRLTRDRKRKSAMKDKEVKTRMKRGFWKPEEDLILKNCVETHGEGNWATISEKSGLMRSGKSCRLRWKNYLRPNIKRGMMSEDEKDLIIRLHKLLGNRWSLIAGRLPGRTDNEVKNFWNTHLNNKRSCRSKKNQVKCKEVNTHSPQDKMQEYPVETVSNQEVATKTVLDSWIEEMQDFNCSLLSPLSMNNVPFLEDEPFIPILDDIVLLEAFTSTCKEAWNEI